MIPVRPLKLTYPLLFSKKEDRFETLKCTDIEIDNDETSISKIQRLAQRFKKIGLTEIKVYNETAGKEGGPTAADFSKFLKGDAIVHEKALKGDAKSHGAS